MRRYLLGAAAALLLAILPATSSQAAPTISHYQMPLLASQPVNVALGGDGNVWFTEANHYGVGKITQSGTVTEYYGLSEQPSGITPGGGSNLWFTEVGSFGSVGRITSGGTATEFSSGLTWGSNPTAIVRGPDGNEWFTEAAGNGAIGRVTSTGAITEFQSGLTAGSQPFGITVGPDGNLWFTEKAGRIGRITTQGKITEFSAGISSGAAPQFITTGPDGNLWFTENGPPARIGRITPQGAVTEFSTGISSGAGLRGITAGKDGNLYFAERGISAIGQITPSGTVIQYSSGVGTGVYGITSGADGNLWFADLDGGTLGRLTVGPGVGDTVPSAVNDTSAKLNATIAPNSQATTYYFEYGTTTAYGSTTSTVAAGSAAASSAQGASITGLTPGTTYHVRAVATNATGTTTGPDHTFTTTMPGAPVATTDDPSGVTSAIATLSATVNPQSAATSWHFEWGKTPSYGNTDPQPDGTLPGDGADHALTQPLSGLEPNTTYYYRVVATSAGGTTYGDQMTFTTDAVAPDAAAGSATGITASGATLAGTVNPRNSGAGWHFEYGKGANFGSSAPDPAGVLAADNVDHSVTQDITGLEPNMTYHFGLFASGNAGETATGQHTFKTLAVPPDVAARDAGDVTTTTATLRGAVNAHNSDSTYHFEWGETNRLRSVLPVRGRGRRQRVAVGHAAARLPHAGHHLPLPRRGELGRRRHPGRRPHLHDGDARSGPAGNRPPVTDPPATDPPTTDPPPTDAPTPKIGTSVVASPETGTVRYRAPGDDHYTRSPRTPPCRSDRGSMPAAARSTWSRTSAEGRPRRRSSGRACSRCGSRRPAAAIRTSTWRRPPGARRRRRRRAAA